MQPKEHWERVYATKATDAVSWYQAHAAQSLRLIRGTGVPLSGSIIDVGGGASTLVDDLLHEGYAALSVLDLSAAALAAARHRLGAQADAVQWIEANITQADLPLHGYDIWPQELDRLFLVHFGRQRRRPGVHELAHEHVVGRDD